MSDDSSDQPFAELPASRPVNRGWFRKGEPGPRLKDGMRSVLVRQGAWPPGDAAVVLRERRAAWLDDLGGPADASTGKTELVQRAVELSAIADHLISNILAEGVISGGGRIRSATNSYLAVVDRILALSRAIGLERRAKHLNFAEALLAAARAADPLDQ